MRHDDVTRIKERRWPFKARRRQQPGAGNIYLDVLRGVDAACRAMTRHPGPTRTVCVLCLAMAAAHATSVWRCIAHLEQDYDRVMAQLEDAQARVARMRRASTATLSSDSVTPLPAMLRIMEQAWRDDIALLQWRADATYGRATAVFRATSVASAFALVDRLHAQGATHARLLRQQLAEHPDGKWRIDATVMVEW